MNIVGAIFEAVSEMIETQYPHLAYQKFNCGYDSQLATEWVRYHYEFTANPSNTYRLVLHDSHRFYELLFFNDGMLVGNGVRIGYEDPHLLGIICGRIFDFFGIRPIDNTFTVGL